MIHQGDQCHHQEANRVLECGVLWTFEQEEDKEVDHLQDHHHHQEVLPHHHHLNKYREEVVEVDHLDHLDHHHHHQDNHHPSINLIILVIVAHLRDQGHHQGHQHHTVFCKVRRHQIQHNQ